MLMRVLLLSVLFVQAAGLRLQDPEEDVQREMDKIEDELLEIEISRVRDFTPSEDLIAAWVKDSSNSLSRQTENSESFSEMVAEACTQQIRQSFSSAIADNSTKSLSVAGAIRHFACADSWSAQHDCSQNFQIPGYRLGDLVRKGGSHLKSHIQKSFPGSLAAKYMKSCHKQHDYACLNRIVRSEDFATFEKAGPSDLVVHVRSGDVVRRCGADFWNGEMCKNKWFNERFLKSRAQWEKIFKQRDWAGIEKVHVFTGDHQAVGNGVSAHALSDKYIDDIIALVKGHTQASVVDHTRGNPDCDFIFMANAKPQNFIGTGGCYDSLIEILVKIP